MKSYDAFQYLLMLILCINIVRTFSVSKDKLVILKYKQFYFSSRFFQILFCSIDLYLIYIEKTVYIPDTLILFLIGLYLDLYSTYVFLDNRKEDLKRIEYTYNRLKIIRVCVILYFLLYCFVFYL